LTPTKLVAYAIAAAVYLVTLVFGAGGIALVVLGFPNPFAIVAGLLLISFTVLMRPRFGRVPAEGAVVREEAPTLFALVDEVARSLATAPVTVLRIDPAFNASWAALGLRRRRVLTLGLPLLTALEPQERVALIAHELAHARNGDATRGVLVGSALRGLDELFGVVAPNELVEAETELGIVERIANWMLYLISRPILGLLLVELHLLLRDSQRAEYLADALSAQVAGTDAVISTQEKLLLEPTFQSVVQHTAHASADPDTDLFAELEAALVAVPDRERERRRRVARLEEARLSDTHPPTGKRIRLLEARARQEPSVVLVPERSAAIDSELARHRPAAQRELVEEYRDSLYA
jgi:Zn-dependent protease with chaperone function